MRRFSAIIFAILSIIALSWNLSSGSAKYAGDFLRLGVGARALGMGSSFVAISDDATAGYWNSAGLPKLRRNEIALMHSEQFGGIVKNDYGGIVLPFRSSESFGLGLIRIGVDGIKYTVLQDPREALSPTNRPQVARIVNNADYALLLSYGRFVREDLSMGVGVKLIRRSIGGNSAFGYGVDIGLLWLAGRGISLGTNLRDATSTSIVWDTGNHDRILPSMSLGVAYSRPLHFANSRLTLSAGAEAETEKSGGDRSNLFAGGLEYWYRNIVALRVGSYQGKLTAGAGLRLYNRVGLDYAFLQNRDLDDTHRVSASVQF